MAGADASEEARLLQPVGAAAAPGKQPEGSCWTTAWMVTMLLLWPVGYWSWAWSQAPEVGMSSSFRQQLNSVVELLRDLSTEGQKIAGFVHQPAWLLVAMLGLLAAAAYFRCGVKEVLERAKHSRCGIFTLHRAMPLADVASDLLITFCTEKSVLCSNPGLWFHHYWWGHISLFLILNSFVVNTILAAPVAVAQLRRRFREMSERTGLAVWTLMGLPSSLVLNVAVSILHPCQEPERGWLSKLLRLQRVVEVLVEAPGQLCLQLWMLLTRTTWSRTGGTETHLPLTLLASLGLSAFHLFSMLKDSLETARAQDMGIREALWEELLVGLNRRAPLLHVMRSSAEVSWAGEGPLSDAFCEQIAKQLARCPNLRLLRFHADNEISSNAGQNLVRSALFLNSGEAQVELSTLWQLRIDRFNAGATAGCAALGTLAQLQHLEIGSENQVGPQGCAALGTLAQLQHLEIGGWNGVGPQGCAALGTLAQLQHLKIGGGNEVGREGRKALSRLTRAMIAVND